MSLELEKRFFSEDMVNIEMATESLRGNFGSLFSSLAALEAENEALKEKIKGLEKQIAELEGGRR